MRENVIFDDSGTESSPRKGVICMKIWDFGIFLSALTNLLLFQKMQKFLKSHNIWQSYAKKCDF